MDNYRQQAKKNQKKAEDKLKGGFFSIFKSKNDKYDEAIDYYKQAINFYKLSKDFELAAELSKICGNLCKEIKEYYDASDYYNDSADLYKKCNREDLRIELLNQSIEIAKINGKFSQCAKISEQLGQIYEEKSEFQLSITLYTEACDFYQMEKHHNSDALKCKNKSAELKCKDLNNIENLKSALKDYEELTKEYLSNNLLKYSAKNYVINVILICLSMGDTIGASKLFDKFTDQDMSLKKSSEGKFLLQLIEASKIEDSDKIAEISLEFDKFCTLDSLKSNLLINIKKLANKTTNNANTENIEDPDTFNPF